MRAGYSVPATSANLGPGYDSFGIALELRNDFYAELADDWSVQIEGEGAGHLRTDGGNQVALSMAAAFERAGYPELRAAISCVNRVPTGNGLGSSSTAIVGGLLLARDLLVSIGKPRFSDRELFEMAVAIEGHPDNVAPALFGGFTICWIEGDVPGYAQFDPPLGLAAVVISSDKELSTAASRSMLPQSIAHADAAFNIAHAGLLAAALVGGRSELLGRALRDRVHEPYRAAAVEDFGQVRDLLLDAGADGVALSGAGPTLIGFVAGVDDVDAMDTAEAVASAAAIATATISGRLNPVALAFAREGSRKL